MINEEKKPVFRQSFKDLLERLKPNEEMKKVFTKKLHRILGLLAVTYSEDRLPTLDEAYTLLGRAHARLATIQDLSTFLEDVSDNSSPQWPQELWDLKENTVKLVSVCERMVLGLLQQQEKVKI